MRASRQMLIDALYRAADSYRDVAERLAQPAVTAKYTEREVAARKLADDISENDDDGLIVLDDDNEEDAS